MAEHAVPPDEPEHQPPAYHPFWSLREDDQRLVFATFLGGLAANVGLVLILALGLLVVRLIHKLGLDVVSYIVLALTGLPMIFVLRDLRRRNSPVEEGRWTTSIRTAVGIDLVLLSSFILALIGYAAGIK